MILRLGQPCNKNTIILNCSESLNFTKQSLYNTYWNPEIYGIWKKAIWKFYYEMNYKKSCKLWFRGYVAYKLRILEYSTDVSH